MTRLPSGGLRRARSERRIGGERNEIARFSRFATPVSQPAHDNISAAIIRLHIVLGGRLWRISAAMHPASRKESLVLPLQFYDIAGSNFDISPNHPKQKNMNAHRVCQLTQHSTRNKLCLLLLSALSGTALLAGSPDKIDGQVVRPLGLPNGFSLTSRDVFDAFHTSAPPSGPTASVPSPLVDLPQAIYPKEFRSIDGGRNAPGNLGSAGMVDLRNVTNGYGDGSGTPAGAGRKSAREVSNIVCAQTDPIANSVNVSGFVWNWGNIVDHDMVLTRVANPAEIFNISVPQCDPVFDPRCRGNNILDFQRSASTLVNNVRTQINGNTAFLDGSLVYGSDITRAGTLRTQDGTGHLATSTGNLMPFNLTGLANQPGTGIPADFFVGGDVRANENLALCSMQTLFMREHNFWADTIKAGDPTLDDDGIFFRARAIVGAEIQLITYRDFIPILLGPNALTPYAGYDFTVDPRVAIAYSTAAFRVGHTFLPPVLNRLNQKNKSIGDVDLGRAIFAPALISSVGIEPYLRGLSKQLPQEVDGYIINQVRSFQVGGTKAVGGFDLAALNIQRGRDHGLPGYNQVRIDYGLTPKATFAEVTSNIEFQTRLAAAYTSPDDMDLWVGGLCEDHFNGGLVGETFHTILKEQLQRTRDGDRFWYEAYLDPTTLATVQAQTLSIIIRRNTTIGTELQDDAFHVPQ